MKDSTDIYQKWHGFKCYLNALEFRPEFKQRDIWWTAVGQNVGFEIFGKSNEFTRPVLILKKYNKQTFLGLPLTTSRRDVVTHYPLDFKDKPGAIILDQGRLFDSKRLIKRMGRLGIKEVEEIKTAFKALI